MIIRYFNVLMAALAVMTMVSCHGAASGHDHDHEGDEAVNEKTMTTRVTPTKPTSTVLTAKKPTTSISPKRRPKPAV